ncbi:MAG: IPT/TIG domain-containing protein [Myxococcota bacterium]
MFLLLGCGESFAPETLVEGLRVLGVRAQPAELRPGEVAQLSALVVDPSRPGKRSTVLWVGCEPDPFNLGRSACSDTSQLSNPSAISAPQGGERQLPAGMKVIGLNDQAAYAVAPDLFAQLPADDRRRKVGVVGQVLAIAVGEEVSYAATPPELEALFARVRSKEVASVVTLFRIRIFEGEEPNTNPTLRALQINGKEPFQGATVRVRPEEKLSLTLEAPNEAFESYEQLLPEGSEQRDERLIAAWYSTAGRFSAPRIALRSEEVEEFTGPGAENDPIPERRTGELYAVVRDTRGGQTWERWPMFVCDEALPPPVVTELQPSSGPADGSTQLLLTGTSLTSVLEVVVGGKALQQAGPSTDGTRYTGIIPALPSGEHAVMVHGKHCEDVEAGRYRVP